MLFAEHRIWRRLDDGRLVLYRCLERFGHGLYAVQSADAFGPAAGREAVAASDARFVELMRDESPLVRSDWHRSLQAAIDAHDRDFD